MGEQVKMRGDLYESAVVGITKSCVEQQSGTPAAAVAKQVFRAIHVRKHHSARLSQNKESVAETGF